MENIGLISVWKIVTVWFVKALGLSKSMEVFMLCPIALLLTVRRIAEKNLLIWATPKFEKQDMLVSCAVNHIIVLFEKCGGG